MDRLTYDEEWGLKGVKREQLGPFQIITNELYLRIYEAIWKLRAYEDIGLTPDQIKDLKKEAGLQEIKTSTHDI